MAHSVAVGEEQDLLAHRVEVRQCAFEVEDADIAAVGFALAAFFPAAELEARGAAVAELNSPIICGDLKAEGIT